jgi:hypothetical protein
MSISAVTPDQALHGVAALLAQVSAQQLPVSAFVSQARCMCAPALDALPPRYAEVWHGLLDRLDSSALFTEESCSFSQRDLLGSVQTWLTKAQAQCARTVSAGTTADVAPMASGRP